MYEQCNEGRMLEIKVFLLKKKISIRASYGFVEAEFLFQLPLE